jgi:geranylgeranyl diphosphate synthase type I
MNRKNSVPDTLKRTASLVQPALQEAVDHLSPGLAAPTRYHFGWVDVEGSPVPPGRHGKGVRPTLAILSAQAVGASPETAIPGAVAVELVHNFSLIHDDIVDNDAERRHRATVWKIFGVGNAIIVGDALMGLALEVLMEEPTAPRMAAAADLTRATMNMITGQHMDMSFDHQSEIDVADSWKMVSHKTGALLAHASAVGAILANAPQDTIDGLRRFGMELGMGFQALDDLLGIWGDPQVTGKPAGNDLRERKMSIPITVALRSGTKAGEQLASLFAKDHLEEADIARAADLVEKAGGRVATVAAAKQRLQGAVKAISAADIEPGPAGELLDLAHFVVDREF